MKQTFKQVCNIKLSWLYLLMLGLGVSKWSMGWFWKLHNNIFIIEYVILRCINETDYDIFFSWFAVTQLYVNNVKFNVSVNVFAPMVPVPSSNIIPSPWSDEPVSIQVSTQYLFSKFSLLPSLLVFCEGFWKTVHCMLLLTYVRWFPPWKQSRSLRMGNTGRERARLCCVNGKIKGKIHVHEMVKKTWLNLGKLSG